MSEDKPEELPGPFKGFVGVTERTPSEEPTETAPPSSGLAWHYTTGVRFAEIDYKGEINPTTGGIGRGGRPVVWFSLNETFEPTARTMFENPDGTVMTLSVTQTEKHGRGLFRVGVRPELLKDLDQWIADSRVPEDTADILKKVGHAHGADPQEWMVSFEPVARTDWVAVEVRYKGEWQSIQDD